MKRPCGRWAFPGAIRSLPAARFSVPLFNLLSFTGKIHSQQEFQTPAVVPKGGVRRTHRRLSDQTEFRIQALNYLLVSATENIIAETISLSKVLRRIANPIEPFGFEFPLDDLPPLLLDDHRGKLGEAQGLFDEANDRLENELEQVHNGL